MEPKVSDALTRLLKSLNGLVILLSILLIIKVLGALFSSGIAIGSFINNRNVINQPQNNITNTEYLR